MRVGLFSDTYTPDINGVVTSIVTLKNALEKEGHTVFVITNQPTLLTTTFEDNVLRLPGIELKFLYGYTLSAPLHRNALEVVREMNLDVAHIHSEFGIGIFGRMAAKSLQIPVVTTYHTQYEDYTHYVNFLGLKQIDVLSKKAVASLSRFYSKNVQMIIAPSEKTKRMLMRYEIRKEIAVIPTGLDLERFKKRDDALVSSLINQYSLADKYVITYVGRIAKEKSIDVVLDGFKKLSSREPLAHLMIVGGGPAMEELKAYADSLGLEKNVTFVGPVKSEIVPSFYQLTDVFVSASLTETQGLTYIEALAAGICVFARPDKPLDGIIIDADTGYLFSSSEEFSNKAYAYLHASTESKNLMKTRALEVVNRFDSQSFARRVLGVYQKAIDSFYGKYTVDEIIRDNDTLIMRLTQNAQSEYFAYDEYVVSRRGVEVGMEMSRNEINSFEEDQRIYEAYQLALSRIGVRDYTSYEMSEYLKEKLVITQEQVDVVIDLLEKRRFINDERYFKDKIMYHREQLRGNQWIVDDLSKRGYTTMDILNEVESEDSEVYLQRGVARAERFLSGLKGGSKIQRIHKLKQHLQRQGFESEVIRDIQNHAEDEYEVDDERYSLEKIMTKAFIRYLRRYDEKEARQKTIKHATSKGYRYDMVIEVMEDIESDTED